MPRRYTNTIDLTDILRRRIVDGCHRPGSRLPTNRNLVAEFGVSSVTAKQALDTLAREGFVEIAPRRGARVAEHPPHLSHYALTFPFIESDLWRSGFYRGLRDAARRRTSPDCRFLFFYNLGGHIDTEDYERLMGLLRRRRLAGVLFSHAVWEMAGLPVIEDLGVPRVGIMSPTEGRDFPTIYPDLAGFERRSLDVLAAQGRRRVAHIVVTGFGRWQEVEKADYVRLAAERGMLTRHHWVQAVSATDPHWASNVARLLIDGPPDQRPDGLVIHDDNLASHATEGLAEAGLDLPRDLGVVAHANFPTPPKTAVPVTYLGFDLERLLDRCLEWLAQPLPSDTPRHFQEALPVCNQPPTPDIPLPVAESATGKGVDGVPARRREG